MCTKRLFLGLLLTSTATAVLAGQISTYTYEPAPKWPGQPTWPAQPSMPNQPSWPSIPSVSVPTLSRSYTYSYGSNAPYKSNISAAQQRLENQLNMNDSPELLRSQQIQWQLQQQAMQSQDAAFSAQRAQQEQLGAAPGLAAEEARKQQEATLRAKNESVLQQWRNTSQ